MPIELHEETQSPQITNCFALLGTGRTYYTRSCVFHHGIINGVQKLYAEFFQKQPHTQRRSTFAPWIHHGTFVFRFRHFFLRLKSHRDQRYYYLKNFISQKLYRKIRINTYIFFRTIFELVCILHTIFYFTLLSQMSFVANENKPFVKLKLQSPFSL